MKINKEQIEKIVRNNFFNIGSIETQNSDRLDFHDVAIWCIVSAIREAYEKGASDAKNNIDA